MDDRIKALMAARPDFSAEEFLARRILKNFELRGKAAKEEAKDQGLAGPWPLAVKLFGDAVAKVYGQNIFNAGVYAIAEADQPALLAHIAGLLDDEAGPHDAVAVFVRGAQDASSLFAAVPPQYILADSVFWAPMRLHPFPATYGCDMGRVIMQKSIDDFIGNLISVADGNLKLPTEKKA